MTASLLARPTRRGAVVSMVAAEVLKLRRRRGLLWTTAALTVGPVVVAYTVLGIQHAVQPARFGPAGGIENLDGVAWAVLALLTVAATLVGITAGGGDVHAGVFRELVVTGRHRLALFALSVAGGVLFLAPFVAVALGIASTASVLLAPPAGAPTPGYLLHTSLWLGLGALAALLLAVGVGAALGGRVGLALLLGWHLALSPILLQTGKLDPALLAAALERLEPGGATPDLSSAGAAAAWIAVPVAVGAWRTATRDT